jgi:hypothetical protein
MKNFTYHSREAGNPDSGHGTRAAWFPAFAGMTICALILLGISVGARAQSRQSRGSTNGSGGSSATATACAEITAPVTIKVLQWPDDFENGKMGNSVQDRSKIFQVGGAPDFAFDVSVPDHAELKSADANIGSVELTGIHNTPPERVASTNTVSGYSGDLRFGLLATPPSLSDDPSGNERGSYVGSCRVTVNYN